MLELAEIIADDPEEKPGYVPLVDAVNVNYIKLLVDAMHDVGPASQTLAAILDVTNSQTFVGRDKLAAIAGLSVRTTERHLLKLEAHRWIKNLGRQAGDDKSWKRRTCTIKLTPRTLAALRRDSQNGVPPYLQLPKWLTRCLKPATGNKPSRPFSYADLATFAAIASAYQKMERTAQKMEADRGYFLHMVSLSLATLRKMTGLSQQSIVAAKAELAACGLIKVFPHRAKPTYIEDYSTPDDIIPNWDAQIPIDWLGEDRPRETPWPSRLDAKPKERPRESQQKPPKAPRAAPVQPGRTRTQKPPPPTDKRPHEPWHDCWPTAAEVEARAQELICAVGILPEGDTAFIEQVATLLCMGCPIEGEVAESLHALLRLKVTPASFVGQFHNVLRALIDRDRQGRFGELLAHAPAETCNGFALPDCGSRIKERKEALLRALAEVTDADRRAS